MKYNLLNQRFAFRYRQFAFALSFVIVFILLCFQPFQVQAQNGSRNQQSDNLFDVIDFPFLPSIKDRMEITFEKSRVDFSGYKQLQFRLRYQSGKSQPNDQTFQVVFFPEEYGYQSFVQEVTIPAGAVFSDSKMSVWVESNNEYGVHWGVYEADSPVSSDNYQDNYVMVKTGSSISMASDQSDLAFFTSAPDFNARLIQWRNTKNRFTGAGATTKSYPEKKWVPVATKNYRHESEFPEFGRDLTSHKEIVVSYEVLDLWQKESPKKCDTLKNWIAMGGHLYVASESPIADLPPGSDAWNSNEFCKSFDHSLNAQKITKKPIDPYAKTASKRTGRRRIHCLGSVFPVNMSFRDKDSDRYHSDPYSSVQTALRMLDSSSDLADLTIPGIGEPPVNMFRILITLFFALVGPFSYFYLKRMKRLHLILFTLPAFAFLASICLIGYSMLADGFQNRGRTLSLTLIDQENEQLVSCTQQIYYSPFFAAKNVHCANDTVVVPVPGDVPIVNRYDENGIRISGMSRARTMNRFAATRSTKTDAKIEIIEAGPTIKFRNRLKGNLLGILIKDAAGTVYYCGATEMGATNETKLCATEATAQIQRIISDSKENPQDLDRYGFRQYATGNTQLHMNAIDALGKLPPNSYYAIVDTSTELPILYPNAKFDASFNVIIGNWK